jgi:hypothetical protein
MRACKLPFACDYAERCGCYIGHPRPSGGVSSRFGFRGQVSACRDPVEEPPLCLDEYSWALRAQELPNRIELHLGHDRPIIHRVSSEWRRESPDHELLRLASKSALSCRS